MDSVRLQNKTQPIVIILKELMFAMIVTQLAMLVLINYLQNAHIVNLVTTYGKDNVILYVPSLHTNMNKVSNV